MQASRKPAAGKPNELTQLDSLAFFADAAEPDEDGVQVQLLCWPTTASAWRALTDAWRVLCTPDLKRSPAVSAAWVNVCAPQVSSVFADLAALETSIASLITRTAVQMSAAISTPARRASRREMFVECLHGYQEFLRTPGRSAFTAAVIDQPTGGEPVDEHFRTAIQGIPFPASPALHHWEGANSPIPLEIARLAAASVARYVSSREASNPIFEAVRGKLISIPLTLTATTRGRRR
jgi:hypothetical protein